ncbi:hypothetical protein GDO78_015148 [Eleutherodactylus coqui]|uniref:Uncharacterized protein n=1 Tax=Eleutherodactylus coqui TaxID=57060 RepID=A0A8J6EE32_ELECQ|nr:hypothetical protein GDO78_015148 [Eleutherodactylus coqui]
MSGVKGNPGLNYEYKEQKTEQPILTPEPCCEVTEVLPSPTCGISEVEQVTPQPPAPLPVKPQPDPQTSVPEQPTNIQEKRGVKK